VKAKVIVLSGLLILSTLFAVFPADTSHATPPNIDCASGNFSEVVSGNEHVITFTAENNISDGDCIFTVPNSVYAIDYLVVGGGGGGNSGGGGAGGLVTSWEVKSQDGNSILAERGSPLTVFPDNRIQVKVGTGGTAGSGGDYGVFGITEGQMPIGTSGNNSQFGSVFAIGGGRGGFGFGCSGLQDTCDQSGASGGSGGGGAYDFNRTNSSASSQSSVIGASTFGHGGGAATGEGGYRAGSGGGGAGGVGHDATELHIGGAGGQGVQIDISGTAFLYACGGGGGINENNSQYNYVWSNGLSQIADVYDGFGLTNTGNILLDQNTNLEWTYVLDGDYFTDPEGNIWSWDNSFEAYTYGTEFRMPWSEFQTIKDTYLDRDGTPWSYDGYFGTYKNVTDGSTWSYGAFGFASSFYSQVSGGGPGGCPDAGRGSDIGVYIGDYGDAGASPATTSTSGLNNFGHGGGGTDPESTVAARGGNGVVVIRFITEDPNCPNNGQLHPNSSAFPIACIAHLKITAGVTSDVSRDSRSIAVLNSPISYSNSGDTVSLITQIPLLEVSIWNGRVLAKVVSSTSPLIGGTYPIMYQIDSGGASSRSFVLITVRDPAQHTQTKVPIDPREKTVRLPKIILGRVQAVQVCVTPRSYSTTPTVELQQNPGETFTDSPNQNNLRMQGSSQSIVQNIGFINLTTNQSRLIKNGVPITLDINVSNTAVGGNGSCDFGTDSIMTIYPLKLTQVRSFTVLPKNGRQNN
jgi:hypothetical protein